MLVKGMRMTINPYPVPQSNRDLSALAWITTAVISALPDIVFDQLSGKVPNWLVYGKTGLLLVLFVAALVWKPLRPLQNFFFIMFAFFGLAVLRTRLDFSWPSMQSLFGRNVFDVRMQAEQTGKLVVSLAMIAILLLFGYKFRDIFLTPGDIRAPIEPVRFLGFPQPDPWSLFGLQWSIYIALGLTIAQYISLHPSTDAWLKVMPILPSISFYAALNAFNEEITYRVPMLATLEPIGGSKNALWMSAFFFGIAHYFGIPGGILGGVLSIFMGWILAKSMLETRGFFWAWWIHFLSDIVIFFFLTVVLLQ